MSRTLNVELKIEGTGRLVDTAGINPTEERGNIGSGRFDPIVMSLGTGAGNSQANQWYLGQRTLAASTGENLDLAALTNKLGPASLAKVRAILVRIKGENGTNRLRVGPQGQANGWQGPFGSTGADAWIAVAGWMVFACSFGDGLGVVSGSSKILRVANPGGNPVTYDLWIIGVE